MFQVNIFWKLSAVRRRRERSIGSIRTAHSRRSEEGGRSVNHCTADQRTHARPASSSSSSFRRLPPCRVLRDVVALFLPSPLVPRRRSLARVPPSIAFPEPTNSCAAAISNASSCRERVTTGSCWTREREREREGADVCESERASAASPGRGLSPLITSLRNSLREYVCAFVPSVA